MNTTLNLLAVMLFSPGQITAIVLISLLVLALIGANIWLIIIYRSRGERKLCTRQLQGKRNDLLTRLNNLKAGLPVEPLDDEPAPVVVDDDEDEISMSGGEVGDNMLVADILAVSDMSAASRARLGFASKVYDDRQYYVRYAYSFEAKLRTAEEEIKKLYKEFYREVKLYKGVKIKDAFRQLRIYKGRKTLGLIMFRGKSPYVAFALNPSDYADTEYRGEDMSGVRRFAKTPLLHRLATERDLEYAKYLMMQLADANTLVMDEHPIGTKCDTEKMSLDEMFVKNILRITVLGEVPGTNPHLGLVDEEEQEKKQYNRSFEARIMQANDALKARYSELKNYIMQYGSIADAKSWQRETFRNGRRAVAAFTIRGKTLCLYLATDPVRFMGTKYKVEDASKNKKNKSLPLMFRIKSDRATMYAKQLIDYVFKEMNLEKNDRRPVDYTMPYKATENLVRRGLIRVKTPPKIEAEVTGRGDENGKTVESVTDAE